MLGNIGELHITMAGDFVVKADWVLGPRRNDDYELVYFPAGNRTRYTADGRTFELSEPCLIITRPGEEHAYEFDTARTTRHLFFHFLVSTPDRAEPSLTILTDKGPAMIPIDETSIIPALLKQAFAVSSLKESGWRQRSRLLVGSALGEAEALASRGTADEPRRGHPLPLPVIRALACLSDPSRLPSMTVHHMAAVTGWSYEHFCRAFKQAVGTSPREALAGRRLAQACRLLIEETLSVKEIAHAVGFGDAHYFSRLFHDHKGMSPTDYRKKFANPRNRHLSSANDPFTAYPLNEYVLFE